MVRHIRQCIICSKRFIALHATHSQCCNSRSSSNNNHPMNPQPPNKNKKNTNTNTTANTTANTNSRNSNTKYKHSNTTTNETTITHTTTGTATSPISNCRRIVIPHHTTPSSFRTKSDSTLTTITTATTTTTNNNNNINININDSPLATANALPRTTSTATATTTATTTSATGSFRENTTTNAPIISATQSLFRLLDDDNSNQHDQYQQQQQQQPQPPPITTTTPLGVDGVIDLLSSSESDLSDNDLDNDDNCNQTNDIDEFNEVVDKDGTGTTVIPPLPQPDTQEENDYTFTLPDNFDDDENDEDEDDDSVVLMNLQLSHPTTEPWSTTNTSSDAVHNVVTTTVDNCPTTTMKNMCHTTCWICGTNLQPLLQRSGPKGRVQHMKRCSKRHNVVLHDLIGIDQDDYIDDTDDNNKNTDPAVGDSTTPAAVSSHGGPRNPYDIKQQAWHDNASGVPSPVVLHNNVNHLLMAGARRKAKVAEIQKMLHGNSSRMMNRNNNKRQRRYNNQTTTSGNQTNTAMTTTTRRTCPKFKRIPGTDFVCDGFYYANIELSKNYFLTHFHSDHYGGITKQWNMGTIYCSIPTANLVHSQLGVQKQYIHPLPLHTPTVIATTGSSSGNGTNGKAITVTLLNANHCPGAIMYLFEVGSRTILHVGDFRWNYQIMSRQPPLRPFCRPPWTSTTTSTTSHPQSPPVNNVRRIDDLFLDTTYCDAQYNLPTQSDCIAAVIETVEQEIRKASKTNILLLFGAYTIGKEAVYMSVAKHCHLKVYVDPRRHRILSSLGWSSDDLSILTTNPELTNLWVVPLGHINMNKMSEYITITIKKFHRTFDRVIGFRPTGWTLPKKKNATSTANTGCAIGTTTKGLLTVHTVPYSEHSSFPELVECLESLNPVRIIPTVNTSKSQQQIDLLMTHWRLKQDQLFLNDGE